MADIFTVLYVTNAAGITIPEYGVLVASQLAPAMLVYIPSAKIADRLGRKSLVIATFVCFALFPVAVVLAKSFAWLVGAFVIGGMREIGEPSRKAMIVDFADEWRLFGGAGKRAGKLFLHSVLDVYKLDSTRYFEHRGRFA
jgi:MFS family permease